MLRGTKVFANEIIFTVSKGHTLSVDEVITEIQKKNIIKYLKSKFENFKSHDDLNEIEDFLFDNVGFIEQDRYAHLSITNDEKDGLLLLLSAIIWNEF